MGWPVFTGHFFMQKKLQVKYFLFLNLRHAGNIAPWLADATIAHT